MTGDLLGQYYNLHFIGIGGVGMSALAFVLLERGYEISGSDINSGHMSAQLAEAGALVYMGHDACQVCDADAVVVSSAIRADNPELVAARERGLPILHRSDILAALLNNASGIAVAGAHGKTTTSAMIACLALDNGLDPTIVIGGEAASLGGNARNGAGPYVVAEADESDGTFVKFQPQLAVVTNIENDHLDHYGSEEKIYQAFRTFLSKLKPGGKAVLCLDNPKVRQLSGEASVPVISYGSADAAYQAQNILYQPGLTRYQLFEHGRFLTEVELGVPGHHNVLNSLAAFAVGRELGLPLAGIVASLAKFSGVKRRFESKGKIGGIWVVDDYAHHPTEIGVTLKAARQTQPQRVLCLFQPHRYSRTQLLFNEFCQCFKGLDELIICEIYPAGERPIAGVSSARLAEAISAAGQRVTYIPRLAKAEEYLETIVQDGDLVLTVGAGDVYKAGEELLRELARRAK